MDKFRREMAEHQPILDLTLLQTVSDNLAAAMQGIVATLLERDSLPALCHIVNGWGDAQFQQKRLVDAMQPFIHWKEKGEPFILQCDPEGDFHPWQSFAYAAMAGVDSERELGNSTVRLRDLVKTSHYINTAETRELGHLLFALSCLDPENSGGAFSLAGKLLDLNALMEAAIDAHHHGSFEVCRKFHLTEGICAAAALIPGLERYREDAQGFLDGQLKVLAVLALVLREAHRQQTTPAPDCFLSMLRDALVVDTLFENHCYLAGHIIELACFAEIQGYTVTEEHHNLMAFVINELNSLIPAFLPRSSFIDCFLHLGHYRRAITLLAECRDAARSGRRTDLAKFTVNFDSTFAIQQCGRSDLADSLLRLTVYELAHPSANPRPYFSSVIEHYAGIAAQGFEARGKFDHFRRMGPSHWPRACHYEILDYGSDVGLEIHLESDAVLPLAPVIRDLRGQVQQIFPDRTVEWDGSWWGKRGRLRVLFPETVPAAVTANAMKMLIDGTHAELEFHASKLLVRPETQDVLQAAVQ
ncbi:MAG TPA: hypothetical protein VFP11_09135 [Candidatus Angelobacter sp.]|nr:hypothetical protein [Candidatus Angelobacter sp.]